MLGDICKLHEKSTLVIDGPFSSFWQKYTIIFGFFLQKNASYPHPTFHFLNYFFAQKYNTNSYFKKKQFLKNTVQLRATRRILKLFVFFSHTKITEYIAFFFGEKKYKKNDIRVQKSEKMVNGNLRAPISHFLTKNGIFFAFFGNKPPL